MMDILDQIDAVTGCQQCAGPLGDSPSGDFCGESCQLAWHANRVPRGNRCGQGAGTFWACHLRGPRYPDGDPRADFVVQAGPDGWPPHTLLVPRPAEAHYFATEPSVTELAIAPRPDTYRLRSINGDSREAWYEYL